jgi:hypothetical protein
MKHIIIPYTALKTELIWFLAVWIFTNLLNIYAILFYNTKWIELITYQPLVIFISLVLYLIVSFIRLLIYTIKKRRR